MTCADAVAGLDAAGRRGLYDMILHACSADETEWIVS
jgi:hypothetical protein